ncbi:MAG: hypothetical protein MUC87_02940 [Bacteroidia bacterium]|jgi:hypothetical protein|nr:hypothetical protein [Bacteroidia bacterium]
MSTSYLPTSDTDRVVWLNNFSNRLGQYRQALGMTTAEVNSYVADAAMLAYVIQLYDASSQYTQALSSIKRNLRSSSQQVAMPSLPVLPNIGSAPASVNSGIFNRLSQLVARIKVHAAYTTAMGQDLGIIAPVVPFDPNTMQPNLSIRLESGYPKIKWNKGMADGTKIYVDRNDNLGFVLLKQTVKNTLLDTQALPPNTYSVTWAYKARFMLDDDEVGLFSQTLSINVIRA